MDTEMILKLFQKLENDLNAVCKLFVDLAQRKKKAGTFCPHPTILSVDLVQESLIWLPKCKFGPKGGKPFGQDLMRGLLKNRIRGDPHHNFWVKITNKDPMCRQSWIKVNDGKTLEYLREELVKAAMMCRLFVKVTDEKPSNWHKNKWVRRNNILEWETGYSTSVPSVRDIFRFTQTTHKNLPPLRRTI